MIRMIGLERFRNDYPAQLSGGMAQRVALVRTLINEPEILLLDEPLGALDEFTRMNMQDEILNIWAQKKQLALMVTHSIDEAVYMGTRVLVMESNPAASSPISESTRTSRATVRLRASSSTATKFSTVSTSAEKKRLNKNLYGNAL